jgi:hypothetical protein
LWYLSIPLISNKILFLEIIVLHICKVRNSKRIGIKHRDTTASKRVILGIIIIGQNNTKLYLSPQNVLRRAGWLQVPAAIPRQTSANARPGYQILPHYQRKDSRCNRSIVFAIARCLRIEFIRLLYYCLTGSPTRSNALNTALLVLMNLVESTAKIFRPPIFIA